MIGDGIYYHLVDEIFYGLGQTGRYRLHIATLFCNIGA